MKTLNENYNLLHENIKCLKKKKTVHKTSGRNENNKRKPWITHHILN